MPPALIAAVAVVAGCGGSGHPRVNPEAMLDAAAVAPDLERAGRGGPQPAGERGPAALVAGSAEAPGSLRERGRHAGSRASTGGSTRPRWASRWVAAWSRRARTPTCPSMATTTRWAPAPWRPPTSGSASGGVDGRPAQPSSTHLARAGPHRRQRQRGRGRLRANLGAAARPGDDATIWRRSRTSLGVSEPLSVAGRVRACVGYDDRVMHELVVDAVAGMPEADRARLAGASAINFTLDVTASDVGEQQQISAPRGAAPPDPRSVPDAQRSRGFNPLREQVSLGCAHRIQREKPRGAPSRRRSAGPRAIRRAAGDRRRGAARGRGRRAARTGR